MEKPAVNKKYKLEKYPGKGGWTYARIPEIKQDKHNPFGWRRVRGSIDGFEIQGVHLMPMGNGHLFLPVKAEIRKKIKKEAGDTVHVILFSDNIPTAIPEELIQVFQDNPAARKKFDKLSDAEQKRYIEWIYSAKTDETKVNRIVRMLEEIGE